MRASRRSTSNRRGVPEGVLGIKADVTDDASVRTAVQQVVEAFGRIDVVVNNAGIGAQGTIEDNPTTSGTGSSTST